ncbi:BLUF domain-containing protein [Fodinicurvata sediminis]|uniref:BLUF domain-containing protein n=1 Tax=Fodinicurvata sediminis TaxID=1121832 RepID=UPI0003B57664|nr:BLUF domain-containing protein [Fodinicurvata sediminis]
MKEARQDNPRSIFQTLSMKSNIETPSQPCELTLLLYVSSANNLMGEDHLVDILRTSRRNNRKRGITGMLLYVEGNFMQVLEGPKAEVSALKKTIGNDTRHHGMTEILNLPAEKRLFDNWSMGFRRLDRENLEETGVTRFLQGNQPVHAQDPTALRILKTFRESMR